MTPAAQRALSIVRDHGGITGGDFACKMWPKDAPHWSVAGWSAQGAARCGGGYLTKLSRKGWLWNRADGLRSTYTISAAGIEALREAEAAA